MAKNQEISHGRNISWMLRAKQEPEHTRSNRIGSSWIVDVIARGTRDGKPFRATHFILSSLYTTPESLLQLLRDRWSIEGWHWIYDNQLFECAHRYLENGAGAITTLQIAAL